MPNWFLDKTLQKRSKIEKVNITIKCCIFKLLYLGTKFRLKLTLLNFWIKLTQKWYFQTKKKNENYHRIIHSQINQDSKFQLQRTILIFGTNFQKKVYFRSKAEKSEHHYWILHNWISLSTNFQFKLTIAIFFGARFPKKGSYFQSKTDKIDTTIEFCIFELVFVWNFTLNKQFWIFGPNLPKKDIYVEIKKKWTSPLKSAYSN